MENHIIQTAIIFRCPKFSDLLLQEQFDLGVHCLPGPVCLNI